MGKPNALRALPPKWFRFTDPEDVAKYGDRWYVYDESSILRQRADVLIALETDLGISLVSVMNGFRESTTLGDCAGAWLGVRAVDQALAGDFDKFTPMTMMIEWSHTDPEPEGKDEGPESTPGPEEGPSKTENAPGSTISAPTDTVPLQSLPISGS